MFPQRCFSKSLLRGVALFGEVSGSRASPFVFQWAMKVLVPPLLVVGRIAHNEIAAASKADPESRVRGRKREADAIE
jgi:hypothetical protein